MRPLKFKTWDKGKKSWREPLCITSGNILLLGDNGEDVIQFTGLLDRHGKEIWERDILLMWTYKNIVKWKDGAFGYFDDSETFHSFADHQHLTKPKMIEVEVIGNIYENPELLEEK